MDVDTTKSGRNNNFRRNIKVKPFLNRIAIIEAQGTSVLSMA
jgi:hypothetical protein